MGNKSTASSNPKIDEKRKQELIQFLISNVIKDEYILKINVKKISNEIPFSPFNYKLGNNKDDKYI